MSTAIAPPAPSKILTYETYMAEETDKRRYDILDGEKLLMPGTTENHQIIQINITVLLRSYQRISGKGIVIAAPRDVLITRRPLRTRQPDVYFMSSQRRTLNPATDDPAPASPAPELVVEIISNSETKRCFNAKIKDYCTVDVLECWKVMPDMQTVEVLRLSPSGSTSEWIYGVGETVQSLTFSGLTVSVDAIFAP